MDLKKLKFQLQDGVTFLEQTCGSEILYFQ